MSLDVSKLKKVKQKGCKIECQCPACFENGEDKTGNHLVIYGDGAYGCAKYPDDDQHSHRIFGLAGIKDRAASIGAPPRPVTRQPAPAVKDSAPRREVCAYPYTDENGTLIYEAVRYEPKGFLQRRIVKGKYVWSLKGVERVPYRLPELIKSTETWIVEGEKDVDRLRNLGICATCRAGGCSTWEQELTQWFVGKEIILCGDNDESGQRYMTLIESSLMSVAKSIKRVKVPRPSKDISEYLEGMCDTDARAALGEWLGSACSGSEKDVGGKPCTNPKFYYAGRGGYAMESSGRFIPLTNEGQVRAHLLHLGVDKDELLSRLCVIREENFVAHIGPVAGFPPGPHRLEDSGEKFLVTSGPSIIEGKAGSCPFIMRFFQEMLEDANEPDQLQSVFSWLHQARKNLVQRQRRPCPAATLVGPRNCGKSLLIELTRLLLGGRVAPAFCALNGTTNFNADIAGAELLTVDDEIVSRDYRARVGLAQGIKRQLFAGSVRCEAKGRDALSLRPVQALIIAVNVENEHLQVLPPLDDSLKDKISLYLCRKANLDGLADREEIMRRITDELPAFVSYISRFTIPSRLADPRTGAAAWQHPEVVELLGLLSPEERLRELLLQCEPITKRVEIVGYWEGTSAEIERILINNATTHHAALRLLTFPGAAGTYLSRLNSSGRVSATKRILKGQAIWKITNLNAKG